MLAHRAVAAAMMLLFFFCSAAVSLANGTNTTYPSQCASDDHPRGCWGNIRLNEVVDNLGDAKSLWQACPNAAAKDFLQASLDDANQRLRQVTGMKRLFQMPQGFATLISLLHAGLATEATSCGAFRQADAAFFEVTAIDHLESALWFARIAGNSNDFAMYVRQFRTELNKALNDSTLPRWPREYVLFQKRAYCSWMVPENGPEYPDYGRLYTWDDFHADRCELFNYY